MKKRVQVLGRYRIKFPELIFFSDFLRRDSVGDR